MTDLAKGYSKEYISSFCCLFGRLRKLGELNVDSGAITSTIYNKKLSINMFSCGLKTKEIFFQMIKVITSKASYKIKPSFKEMLSLFSLLFTINIDEYPAIHQTFPLGLQTLSVQLVAEIVGMTGRWSAQIIQLRDQIF